jgi:hypothetical protein
LQFLYTSLNLMFNYCRQNIYYKTNTVAKSDIKKCFCLRDGRSYASNAVCFHFIDFLQKMAASNTSTVALRVVGSDKKRTQCLGLKLGHSVHGGYKYGDLALQVGGISNLRQ